MPLQRIAAPVMCVVVVMSAIGLEKICDRTEPPGRIHVVYWEKWTGTEYDGIRASVDDFNRSQNRIFVDLLSISDIAGKTMFATSAGVPPDVAGVWASDVPHYADDRAAVPLDDFCRENGITREHYIPCYWDMVNYHGHVWALPSTPTSSALHYNPELFKKAGLDPNKPPATIEELDADSDRLAVKRNGHLIAAGFMPNEPGYWDWGWGYVFGGKLWDGVSKVTPDSPENIRAFEWIQSLYKKAGPGELEGFKNSFGNSSTPQNSFVQGQVAIELQGVWQHYWVSQFAPQMKMVVAPFPHPADRPDLANCSFVGSDVYLIPRGARHPREAFEFIKYMQMQGPMEKLCMAHQKNSPLNEISDFYWTHHKNPDIRLFDTLARSKNTVFEPQTAVWPEYSRELGNAMDEITLMTTTPKKALRKVRERVQPMMDEYLARLKLREAKGL